MSPSPSTSATNTDRAPSAVVEMICSVKFWVPSFSYQAIVSSSIDAESTSMSPSPSTSAANTDWAPSAPAEITFCPPKWPSAGEGLAIVTW